MSGPGQSQNQFMVVETGGKHRVHRRHLFLTGTLMLLSLVALTAWHFIPIYPDEIAFRMQAGRYIQDQGVAYGFYPLCASNVKDIPLFFVIPAWIMSWLDLALSPVEMRIFPFAAILTAMCLAILYAVKGVNPNAAVVVTTSLIGVAGSGLTLARAEYVQTLNIVCCLLTFQSLQSLSQQSTVRYGLLALLLSSSVMSLFAHIQGLLFVPLTLYLAHLLVYPILGNRLAGLLVVVSLILMAQTTISFHHSSCMGYPDIEHFWARMTLNGSDLQSISVTDWVQAKFSKYLSSFRYESNYVINYLPGITGGDGWQESLRSILNEANEVVLVMNFVLCLCATIGASIFLVSRYAAMYRRRANGETVGLIQGQALVLFAVPILFLFFYDSAQNFYRSFFLNLLTAILVALWFSRIALTRVRTVTNLYFSLCGILVFTSMAVNVFQFSKQLYEGYEGPSISLSRDWDGIARDVKALATDCCMDLSKGRIVLDDMTYDSLKSYPLVYPVTYLHLSVNILKSTMAEVLDKVRPNYAIARCDALRGASITFQKSRNQLCCTNFLSARALK
jgi:hypothetical protein